MQSRQRFLMPLALGIVLFCVGSPAIAAPIVTLIETIRPPTPDLDSWGEYTLVADDLDGNVIVGFAVNNAFSIEAWSMRNGWSGEVVTDSDWNGGFAVTFNRFAEGLQPETKSLGGLGGPMDQLWVGATQANVYWRAFDDSLPIVSFETAGAFFFSPAQAESTLYLFLQAPDGTIFFSPATVLPPPPVPEPATLSLLGFGIAALVAIRRRRAPGGRRVAS